MAKKVERDIAETYYVDLCLTAKEISERLGVTEKTVGDWVEKYGWKALKTAKQSSAKALINSLNNLLEILVDKRIAIEKGEEKGDAKSTIDDISKINKTIETLNKKGKPSLSTYIHCVERFMNALHAKNPELFFKTLEFQKEHIQIVAAEQ